MIGSVLGGRYELLSVVSDGPVYSAWSARDQVSGKDVTIRVLKSPGDPEPELVAALNSVVEKYRRAAGPLIESVHRVVSESGMAFLVSDSTRGPNLADRIRKLAPFSVQVAVGMAVSLCRALEILHRVQLPHGDLHPGHCIVLANGDVKVQLPGIWETYAKSDWLGMAVLPHMAPYMAPEIVGGALPTPESDVYAIGAMMFELLTGRQPYYAVSSRALLQEHVNRAVPDVRSLNPSVPDVLSKIIQKAMHKNPAMRYQGAHDLLADLRLVQEALRFGKSLVWPLRPEAPDEVTIEPGPVAPRMSAIRETPSEEKVKKRRHERDVPTWMLLTMTFLGAVLLMLIGFYTIENLRRPRTVRVPNITMLSVAEARDMLAKLKLELRVQSREPNERVEADRVLSASPAPGREVRERGVVNVVVSAGSSTILMPDLKGETLDKARTILENLSLNPEPLTEQRSSSEVEFGRVIDTDPPAKTKVLRKTRVKLVISAGSVADPSEISKSFVYSLRITVSDTTDNTLVRVEISDIQGARTVYEGTHQPEDTIECEATGYGGSATFRIYYDDRLVKEFEQRAQR